jgi:hypothetical protein
MCCYRNAQAVFWGHLTAFTSSGAPAQAVQRLTSLRHARLYTVALRPHCAHAGVVSLDMLVATKSATRRSLKRVSVTRHALAAPGQAVARAASATMTHGPCGTLASTSRQFSTSAHPSSAPDPIAHLTRARAGARRHATTPAARKPHFNKILIANRCVAAVRAPGMRSCGCPAARSRAV